MISALLLSSFLGALPDVSAAITEARRTFIEDGDDRVSATPTHRIVAHADGSLELEGRQPLRLSLQSVRREGAAPCRAEARTRTVDGRTLHTARACALEETWTNGPGGLSHGFTLQRPPAGRGGLTLFLSVEGPWHHQDLEGHVFRGPGASDTLRYGNAFVVRGGRKLPIAVTRVEGGLELKVPRALVDAPGAFPMVIDPMLSAEVALDPNAPELAPPLTDEQRPAIATNTLGQALVVWEDDRRQNGTDLFGARLGLDGVVVDAAGLPVSLEPGQQLDPTICGEGTGWLVAYASEVVGGVSEVRAVRVNDLGQVGAPFVVKAGGQPALAARGTSGQSVIALVDSAGALQVAAITGTAVTPEGASTTSMGVAAHPAIAATATKWFAAWESSLGGNPPVIRGLTKEAGLLTPLQLSSATNVVSATRPAVAMGPGLVDDQAFIFWEQGGSVVGKRYGGVATDTIINASSPALVMTSAVAGAQPTLGYFQNASLKLVDLNDGGVLTRAVSVGARELALAASGRLYAVWTENLLGGGADVWSFSLAAGAVPPPLPLARAAPVQRLPHVAFPDDQADGLAVWVEGPKAIRGARVQQQNDGSLSLGTSFPIADALGAVLSLDLAASGSGNDFLVTWLMAGGVVQGHLTTRDSADGVVIPFNIAGAVSPPAVAWDAQTGQWVVAWGTPAEVVSRTLVPRNAPSALRTHAAVAPGQIDLSCLRGKCLVAWEFDGGVQAGLYGVVSVSTTSGSVVNGAQPAVTHDGTGFVLGWRSSTGLSFTRLDLATMAVDALPTVSSSTGGRVSHLSLAPGTPPVAAWLEADPAGAMTVTLERLGQQPDQRVSLPQGELPVVGTVGTLAGARGAVVYQRFDPEPNLQSTRAWGVGFVFPAPPDAGVDAGIDAGVPDGGVDAGLEDAGTSDAGSGEAPDAGVMIFQTTGCTCQSLDAVPLALLLLLWRRRARG